MRAHTHADGEQSQPLVLTNHTKEIIFFDHNAIIRNGEDNKNNGAKTYNAHPS